MPVGFFMPETGAINHREDGPMALQMFVESLETLPENVRSLYAQDGDKFRLQLDGYEDPAGLKSALQKERDAAKAAQKQAGAWAQLGKTPEEIQQLVEAQRKAEEEKLKGSGEWDKLKAQMLEQTAKEREQLESKLKAKDSAIERYLIDAQAVAAISEMKGVPALLLPHVKAAVKVVEDGGEYATRVVDAQGNPRVNGKGEFLSIKDLVSEMRQSEIFGRAFEPTGTTGGGAQGGAHSGGSKRMTQAAFDALPPKQRAARMAEGFEIFG